jgi:hypothetical protein
VCRCAACFQPVGSRRQNFSWGHKLKRAQVKDGPYGECDDEVYSPSGRWRRRGGAATDGGCGGRNAGSQLGAMRSQLVPQCMDQRVQTATAATTVVQTSACVRANLRAAVGAPTPASAALGADGHTGMEPGPSTVGHLCRPSLDANLAALQPNTMNPPTPA